MSNTELVAIPLLLGLCALLAGWLLPAKIRLAFTLVGWFAALVITLALVSLLQPSQLAYRLDAPSHNKLAEQARQELRKLEIPVKIRFYSSADAAQASHEWRQNARLVGKVLQQIVEHNPSMLQLEVIAPAADSLEEQQALAEGMQSQQYNNHDLWCGISLRALDRQRQFKLLKNTNAALLEQQLLSAIHELGRWNAPRIGVLSSFKLLNAKPQSHSDESWLVRSQLTRRYQVETLDFACTHIPEHLDTLLVLHPSNISTPTLQALEQFLQRGGKLVACLDAYSVMAASLRQEMPPQMLPQLPRQASGLGELLKHWGVEFQFGKIVADPLYASDISNQTQLPSLLSLGSGAFTDGQITSSGLEDVFLVLSGGFELKQPQNWQVLAKASDEAFWQSWNEASAQQKERRPDSPSAAGTALFITSSAALPCYFSPGQYSSPQAKVWLLGDCDFLANDYAYNIERNQSGIVSARQSNHNLNLLYNILDVATNRQACNYRPLEQGRQLDKLEAERRLQAQKLQQQIQAERQNIKSLQASMAELQAKKSSGELDIISYNNSMARLLEQLRAHNRSIRELQNGEQQSLQQLKYRLLACNLGFALGLLALVVLIGKLLRRSQRRQPGSRNEPAAQA